MNTGLTKKLIAFVLTAMLAVTFSTPAFAAAENVSAANSEVSTENVSAANSGAAVSSDTLKTDGEDPATGWVVIGDETYYQDEEGNYVTGWQVIDEQTYYFSESGVMQTGWQEIDGAKYYFQESGQMTTGWKKLDGKKYYFNKTGKMRTGWLTLSGKKYYFKTTGVMVTGWKTINGKKYYFKTTGVMVTGWKTINKKKYYFKTTGVMTTGWKTIKGSKYHFTKYGVMQKGFKLINGSHYYFLSDGVMADLGIYKKWMISYTGKCYKIPKATKSKSASEKRMAKLIAKCSGKYSKKMKDIEKVSRAAIFIQILYEDCRYSMKGSNYNRPYGVFYAKVASCAGTTRALGLVLTKMGIKWKHVNENKYKHQWCSVTMDGKKGWADGMIGMCDYGKYPY